MLTRVKRCGAEGLSKELEVWFNDHQAERREEEREQNMGDQVFRFVCVCVFRFALGSSCCRPDKLRHSSSVVLCSGAASAAASISKLKTTTKRKRR